MRIDMISILPELAVLLFSVFFLFVSLGDRKRNPVIYAGPLSFIIIVASLFTLDLNAVMFSGAYKVDLFSQVFKIMLAVGFSLVLFMLGRKNEVEETYSAEFFMFLGFSVLGLMMLSSSVELISILISLEISSYSLYVIVPLRKGGTKIQIEASMKYLFFGAVATGVMLFGMGYLYAIAKSTFLTDIVKVLPSYINQPIGIIAVGFTLTGFFFKLSLFPFHFWSPDIYEGASNSTTSFISTVPKIAAVAILVRIVMLASPGGSQFINVLIVLAAFSMTFGNLVGLVQKDLKRLLAYSGIAHAGYVMLGVLSMSNDGNAAAVYYIAVYMFMNLACFYVVVLLSRNGENPVVDDLAGLAKRSPLLGFLLAASAFSLAGIPPAGGFTGKLFLLMSAFNAGHLNIVIVAAVNTAISIFYYLNLVRISYSRGPSANAESIKLSFQEKTLCCIFIVMILYTGLAPFGLLEVFKSMV
jgi:NADH-quinone oxidoreductase subunit N